MQMEPDYLHLLNYPLEDQVTPIWHFHQSA